MQRRLRRLISNKEPEKIDLIVGIANRVLVEMRVREQINETVKWDEQQCEISPGDLACALILTMFFEERPPLYKVDEWYRNKSLDVRALFGTKASYHKLSDVTLGRMLDKLGEVNMGNLFMQISTATLVRYAIMFKRLHSDTTSVSFYGEYLRQSERDAAEEEDEGSVRIVRGYSKDNKRECKQVVVGKIVNEYQIPMAMMTLDGNTPDVEWNRRALTLLSELTRQGMEQGLYVADSKLMTKDLFARMNDPKEKIPFVSRVPANFADKLERDMTQRAWREDRWEAMGALGEGKHACHYWTSEYEQDVLGVPVQLIVVRSGAGEERYERKLIKWKEELTEQIGQVTGKRFACLADAQAEYGRFVKQVRSNPYPTSAEYTCEQVEKKAVGRPSLKQPKPGIMMEVWTVAITVGAPSAEAMQQIKAQESCHVLITNELSYTPRQILEAYKGQQAVEIDFRYLKDNSVASAIFVKTPKRIEALLMLMHIALLVSSLIQYRLRKGRASVTQKITRTNSGRRGIPVNMTTQYMCSKMGGLVYRASAQELGAYDFVCEHERVPLVSMFLEMLGCTHEDIIAALYEV